jgi:hypothetical protein
MAGRRGIAGCISLPVSGNRGVVNNHMYMRESSALVLNIHLNMSRHVVDAVALFKSRFK